jgi:hypothetical protein
MKKQFLFFLTFIPFFAYGFSSNNLPDNDLHKLSKGEMILIKREVKGSVWPALTIYKKIDVTPLEAASIFMAFDHQKSYVMDVIKSNPISMDSPTSVTVEYERKNPWPVPDESYTNVHHFKKLPNGYHINWWALESSNTEKVVGDAYFVDFKGKTLLQYKIEVHPKLKIAGMFTGTMIEKTKDGIEGVVSYIEFSKSNKPDLMKKYKKMLSDSFKGIWSYKALIKPLPKEKK